ncbi:MAG: hypothetical protein JWP11_2316 [Frankiales bacterium]|nr:hypothetical protein [Frankiales bacterium]
MSSAAGAVTQHAAHFGTLVGPVLLIAFWASWSELRAWMRRQDVLVPTAVLVAAALSLGAAVIHGIVVPPHLQEDPLYGGFFVALTAAQLAWAVAVVVRPQRTLLVAGALGNLGVVLLWGVTRTAGIPLGVAAGQREGVGVLDLSCSVLELGVVACCALLLVSRRPALAPA